MQRLVGVGLCVGVVLATTSTRLDAAEVFSVTYDQRMETAGYVMSSNIKIKGDRFRSETTMEGIQTIMLRTPSGFYQYLPEQGMAEPLEATRGRAPGSASGHDLRPFGRPPRH